jgi:transcriptional regulator with XRE-family HTH domain
MNHSIGVPGQTAMADLKAPLPAEFRATREKAKLSQNEVAEMLGVHRNTVQNWEHGRRECHPVFWAYFNLKLEERKQQYREILNNLVKKHRYRRILENLNRKLLANNQ